LAALGLRSLSRYRAVLVGARSGRAMAAVVGGLALRHRGLHFEATVKLGLGRSGKIVFI
jgi:hypothetical protein